MSFNPTHGYLNGNVGQEPESVGKGETAMAAFTVACSQGKDKKPIWMDVVAFGLCAQGVLEQVSKGTGVIVTGRLAQDYWDDKEGNPRSKIKFIADEVAIKCFPTAL